MVHRERRTPLSATALALSLVLTACGGDRTEATSAAGLSSSGSTGGTSGAPEPTTGVDEPTTSPPACADLEDQPIDSVCNDASGCGCDTGKCFSTAFGGRCGECVVDADCPAGGCSIPNVLAQTGSRCNMGEPAQGCMTDEICTDPAYGECGTLLEVPSIFKLTTCGQCKAAADCPEDQPNCAPCPVDRPNCTPVLSLENFNGALECVADASVENNEGCSLVDDDKDGAPDGGAACKSGFCSVATTMLVVKLGICGECNADTDCPMDMTCMAPVIDLAGKKLIGSVCM
jgi:hypothetical protein